ncbi:hypothetical protein B0J18DRAFT_464151 [Chaetomium sp. MPI-SDFR-AT-0129]|nr:hypothetical protein B0J18DRAFT_464151 [Chaetomium sp. MPI-SDFR-AT-0129]
MIQAFSLVLFTAIALVNALPQPLPSHARLLRRQNASALDPSVFLRRAYHASAVLNHTLYIDGGELSYQNGSEIIYQYSNTLLSLDLTHDFTNDSVTIQSVPKPTGVPNLSHGGIWINQKEGTLYTGFSGTASRFGDQAFSPQGLWVFTPDDSAGESSNGSPQLSAGSIIYDMSNQKVYNYTSSGPNTIGRSTPNLNGTTYIPNWGNRGIIVGVGGTLPAPRNGNSSQPNPPSFQTIQIYDVDKERWYDQKTTGAVPEPRKDFCIVGSPSRNQTHEILVYAGWNGQSGPSATAYDTAHVLSLPGFYWVKVDYEAARPRHGLSCEDVGGSQILIIGGVDSTQNGSDSYAAGFMTKDPFPNGLAVFDLAALAFGSMYHSQRYPQPPSPRISAYYDDHGRAPEDGFANSDLETLFKTYHPTPPTPATLQPPPPQSTASILSANRAAAIGGTIGSATLAALITWIAVAIYRYRHRHLPNFGHSWWRSGRYRSLGIEDESGLLTTVNNGSDNYVYDGEAAQFKWYRGVLRTMPRTIRRDRPDCPGAWENAYRRTRGNFPGRVTGPIELASDPIYELEGDGPNEQFSDSESGSSAEYVLHSGPADAEVEYVRDREREETGEDTERRSGGAGPSTWASSRPRRMPVEPLDELLKDMGFTK